MATRRYSGRAKLVCRFRDKENDYDCEVYCRGTSVGRVGVGLPGAWSTLPEYQNGVDSDEAFDAVAKAAFAFALAPDPDDEDFPLIEDGDVEWGDQGVVVHRTDIVKPQTRQRVFDFGRRKP